MLVFCLGQDLLVRLANEQPYGFGSHSDSLIFSIVSFTIRI
jgi:hypothetical protein